MLDEEGMHLCDLHSYKRTFVNICDAVGIEDAVAHKLSNHAKQGVHDRFRNMTPSKRKFLHLCLQQIIDDYDVEPKVRLHYDSGIIMAIGSSLRTKYLFYWLCEPKYVPLSLQRLLDHMFEDQTRVYIALPLFNSH
jgi:hypothetical protein